MARRSRSKAPQYWAADTELRIAAVNATHKTGKRKRGNSLTKKAPKTHAHAITHAVYSEHGEKIAEVRTVSYKRA
jgi:hypothetical protein